MGHSFYSLEYQDNRLQKEESNEMNFVCNFETKKINKSEMCSLSDFIVTSEETSKQISVMIRTSSSIRY